MYDITGRIVNTLFNGVQEKGMNLISWDGKNQFNNEVSSGVYLYTIKTQFGILSGKMMLLK